MAETMQNFGHARVFSNIARGLRAGRVDLRGPGG